MATPTVLVRLAHHSQEFGKFFGKCFEFGESHKISFRDKTFVEFGKSQHFLHIFDSLDSLNSSDSQNSDSKTVKSWSFLG
jgi:hypothetical protein